LPTPEEPPTTVLDQAILDALQAAILFFSGVAKLTCIPSTRNAIAWLYGEASALGSLQPRPTQNPERVTPSNELPRQLYSIDHQDWQFTITLDESWFHRSTDHEYIWLRPEEQPLEKPKHMSRGPKMMLTIAWNPLGLFLSVALSKSRNFNTDYFCDTVLMEVLPLRLQVDETNLLFIRTMQGPTQLESIELSHRKQTETPRAPTLLT
jgi:hypothetical protein